MLSEASHARIGVRDGFGSRTQPPGAKFERIALSRLPFLRASVVQPFCSCESGWHDTYNPVTY